MVRVRVHTEWRTLVEPVANLRRVPSEAGPSYAHDDLTETQLLFGECVRVREEEGEWSFVEAVEQEVFRKHSRWEGYPGWVWRSALKPIPAEGRGIGFTVIAPTAPVLSGPSRESGTVLTLSLGTRIPAGLMAGGKGEFSCVRLGEGRTGWIERGLTGTASPVPGKDEDRWRQGLLATAHHLLGTPYLWGGRSMHMPSSAGIATGVDCSGLVNLVFRVHGVDVPRDAHEQWMRARPLPAGELKPGDLIFLARDGKIMNHVMIFAGDESFIEAPETGERVRIMTFEKKFGMEREALNGRETPPEMPLISYGRIGMPQ